MTWVPVFIAIAGVADCCSRAVEENDLVEVTCDGIEGVNGKLEVGAKL